MNIYSIVNNIWIVSRPFVSIALMLFLIGYFGVWGFWGFVFAFSLYGLFKLFTNWSSFILIIKQIETTIWGRPLDKIYGKPPKVKILWRKKKK